MIDRYTIRFAAALALLLVFFAPGDAHADRVDSLISKLKRSGDYKVRLSAALNLAKVRDKRAIPAFMIALSDKDRTVRQVAAAALGKLVDGSVSEGRRSQILNALRRTASKDKDKSVRTRAQNAYEAIKKLAGGSSGGGGGGVFVDISKMASEAPGGGSIKALMRRTALSAFKKKARSMSTSWPGGKSPSMRQLQAKKMVGFHVHGTLNKLTASKSGGTTLVSCKVSMLLATYPAKSMFGFLSGGAKVQAGSSEKDVGFAKEDCVAAVVEDLITRKIIPTIKSRAR